MEREEERMQLWCEGQRKARRWKGAFGMIMKRMGNNGSEDVIIVRRCLYSFPSQRRA